MCAHKYRQWHGDQNVPNLLTGQCYLLGDNLKVGTEERTWRRVVCDLKHLSNRQRNQDWFAFCQQGHGASFAKDGKSLLFGAPGAYQWTGEEGHKQLEMLFCFLVNLEGQAWFQLIDLSQTLQNIFESKCYYL